MHTTTPKHLAAGLSLLFALLSCQPSNNSTTENQQAIESAPSSNAVGIGQPLKTDYFEVTVNKVSLAQTLPDNSGLGMDVKADPGTKFLVINVTFKNTDSESRMAVDGSVHINYGGKDYNFDSSETVMLDGYGLLLDQLNPLIQKTTNLVYKIPAEVTGDAYYNPGRADSDERIILGKI